MASVFRRIIKSQSILNNGDVDLNYSVNNISVAFNVCLNVKLLSLSWIHLKILIAFAIGFEHVSITIIKQINTTSLLKYQYIVSLFLLLHCLMNKILNIIPFMCKNNNQIRQDIFNGLNSINKQILFASQYSLNIDPNEMNKPNECKTNFLFAVMIDKNINICQIIYRVFHMISSDVSSIDINDASVESNESQSVFNVNHDDGINVYKSHHYIHNKYIPLVISIYDIIYKLNNNIFNIIFRPSKTPTTTPPTTHQGGGYGVGDDNNGQVDPNGVEFNDKEMMSTNNTNYSPLYYVISALLISICCISVSLFCWVHYNHKYASRVMELKRYGHHSHSRLQSPAIMAPGVVWQSNHLHEPSAAVPIAIANNNYLNTPIVNNKLRFSNSSNNTAPSVASNITAPTTISRNGISYNNIIEEEQQTIAPTSIKSHTHSINSLHSHSHYTENNSEFKEVDYETGGNNNINAMKQTSKYSMDSIEYNNVYIHDDENIAQYGETIKDGPTETHYLMCALLSISTKSKYIPFMTLFCSLFKFISDIINGIYYINNDKYLIHNYTMNIFNKKHENNNINAWDKIKTYVNDIYMINCEFNICLMSKKWNIILYIVWNPLISINTTYIKVRNTGKK